MGRGDYVSALGDLIWFGDGSSLASWLGMVDGHFCIVLSLSIYVYFRFWYLLWRSKSILPFLSIEFSSLIG